jgi:hypothetical protein
MTHSANHVMTDVDGRNSHFFSLPFNHSLYNNHPIILFISHVPPHEELHSRRLPPDAVMI